MELHKFSHRFVCLVSPLVAPHDVLKSSSGMFTYLEWGPALMRVSLIALDDQRASFTPPWPYKGIKDVEVPLRSVQSVMCFLGSDFKGSVTDDRSLDKVSSFIITTYDHRVYFFKAAWERAFCKINSKNTSGKDTDHSPANDADLEDSDLITFMKAVRGVSRTVILLTPPKIEREKIWKSWEQRCRVRSADINFNHSTLDTEISIYDGSEVTSLPWCYKSDTGVHLARAKMGKKLVLRDLEKSNETIVKLKYYLPGTDAMIAAYKSLQHLIDEQISQYRGLTTEDPQYERHLPFPHLGDTTTNMSLHNTKWLKYVRKGIKFGRRIACRLRTIPSGDDNTTDPCLILKEDGANPLWLPVITSITIVILDSHSRTLRGFESLIDREFVHRGYQFHNSKDSDGDFFFNSGSLTFFHVFLEAVKCLIELHPCDFEFSEHYLITLLDGANSDYFAEFIRDRKEHLREEVIKQFLNDDYYYDADEKLCLLNVTDRKESMEFKDTKFKDTKFKDLKYNPRVSKASVAHKKSSTSIYEPGTGTVKLQQHTQKRLLDFYTPTASYKQVSDSDFETLLGDEGGLICPLLQHWDNSYFWFYEGLLNHGKECYSDYRWGTVATSAISNFEILETERLTTVSANPRRSTSDINEYESCAPSRRRSEADYRASTDSSSLNGKNKESPSTASVKSNGSFVGRRTPSFTHNLRSLFKVTKKVNVPKDDKEPNGIIFPESSRPPLRVIPPADHQRPYVHVSTVENTAIFIAELNQRFSNGHSSILKRTELRGSANTNRDVPKAKPESFDDPDEEISHL